MWFFRTSPHDEMFTAAMFEFFDEMGKKTKRPVKTIALFYEDSIFGSDSSNVQRKMAEQAGIKVVADVKYRANSPSLSSEAQRLVAAKPDVIMPSSYTSDAILLMRTLSELHYVPVIMAQAAGFQEQAFLTGVGKLADGVFSRSSFAGDAVKARPAIPVVTALFKAKTGKDLNDNTSREIVATQVLADAINRAGSAKPADIRTALMATDVPGDQTIMPWKGIRFDSTGQNVLATPVIQQVMDGRYRTVFPEEVAAEQPVWKVGEEAKQ
jgi:branched-chain amino acid transport system substrate-binding protein